MKCYKGLSIDNDPITQPLLTGLGGSVRYASD